MNQESWIGVGGSCELPRGSINHNNNIIYNIINKCRIIFTFSYTILTILI